MDEDDLAAARKHKVGPAGQTLAMEPKTTPHTMDKSPNYQFGLGVLATNGCHTSAALFGSQDVWHHSLYPQCPSR
jgi:hypothetical protein